MKSFKHQTNYDTKKILIDNLILKVLPYGKWTTEDDKEYLFNRDYEPIHAWNLKTNKPIPITQCMWIGDHTTKQEFYYDDSEYPTRSIKSLRKCWDILADWSERSRR